MESMSDCASECRDRDRQSLLLSSRTLTRSTGREKRPKLIPMRPAHVRFFSNFYNHEPPDPDNIFGYVLVDEQYRPLACGGVEFFDTGVCGFAHFGKFARKYPTILLDACKRMITQLRDAGFDEVYVVADEAVEGSTTLIEWFNGQKTDQWIDNMGWMYVVNLHNTRF